MDKELSGFCPICKKDVQFVKTDRSSRSLTCDGCKSLPRNRAVWVALRQAYPEWRSLSIHESSPGWDAVSRRLKAECRNYVASQYDSTKELGSLVTETSLPCKQYFVQNLERQTFGDEQFDLVITQDVFEHIMDPVAAIREIEQVWNL